MSIEGNVCLTFLSEKQSMIHFIDASQSIDNIYSLTHGFERNQLRLWFPVKLRRQLRHPSFNQLESTRLVKKNILFETNGVVYAA